MSVTRTYYMECSNTQTVAWSVCTPLFDQLIRHAVLKWSISGPSASATVAE